MTSSGDDSIPTFGPAIEDEDHLFEVHGVARTRLSKSRAWATIVAAGIAAGIVAWGAGEWAFQSLAPAYQPSKELSRDSRKSTLEVRRQRRAYDHRVALVTYGALGASLGLALALAGGYSQGLPSRALRAALAGLVAGFTVCGAVVRAAVPYYYRAFDASSDRISHDLLLPLAIHALIWSCAGLVAGGSLGLGLGSARVVIRGALGGGIGALLATILYEVVAALRFPNTGNAQPIPQEWVPRLIALSSVATLATIAAFSATGFPPRPDGTLAEDETVR